MARGIKKNPNRNEVRSIAVNVRMNYYEHQQLIEYMNTFKDNRTISTFIRDIVNATTKEVPFL